MGSVTWEETLAEADGLLLGGDLDGAECVLRGMDTREQRSYEVLGRLGWIQQQRGRHPEAIALFQQALAANPDPWQAWSALALSWQQMERIPEAVEALTAAITLAPDMPDLRLHLAEIHNKAGAVAEAEKVLRDGLSHCPMEVGLWNNLAILLEKAGRCGEAVHAYESALALNPSAEDIRFNLALALHSSGRTQEALLHYDAMPEPHRALPVHRLHRAQALAAQFRLPETIAEYRKLLVADSDNALVWNNLGSALHDAGDYSGAREALERVLHLDPDCRQARYNLALLDLTEGHFSAGWAGYEARDTVPPRPEPRWQGEPLAGETIAVVAEQGMGDILQFLRFLPWLAQRGGRAVLVCDKALHRLVEGFPGISGLVASGGRVEGARWHVPLMSLAGWSGAQEGNIPWPEGYLGCRCRNTAVAHPSITRTTAGLRAAIVWRGNPLHAKDRFRSIPVSSLAPLFQGTASLPLEWTGLQGDVSADEISFLQSQGVVLPRMSKDWAETAAQVEEMDVVISVDTAMAHLAGALGKPVWILLPQVPDWRWQLDRRDSPWYGTARLFRQPSRGDWRTVLEEVAQELVGLASNFIRDA